jgi:hypothetical protein
MPSHPNATVQKDMEIIKKAWANVAEGRVPKGPSFTPYISKNQQKKQNKLARSANSFYNTGSKGVPTSNSH